ncbi:MAG: carboxypeptidase-like regulatory domain-containing protein [Thermoanaerobaculia bacterium]
MRRVLVALFVTLVAGGTADAADRGVVICDGAGACRSGRESDLSQQFDHAWVWSSVCAARRVRPGDDFGCQRGALAPFHVSTPRKGERIVIISAPAEMWREVPEDLIPRFALQESQRTIHLPVDSGLWRARAISQERGAWWCTAAGPTGCRLDLLDAPERFTKIVERNGTAVAGASVSIVERTASRRKADVLAVLTSSQEGEVRIARVPGREPVTMVISATRRAPLVVQARPGELPPVLTMEPGAAINGRIAVANGRTLTPLANAEVGIEAWLPGVPVLYRRSAVTKADGRFLLEALPPGTVGLSVRREGYATERRELELQREKTDLHDIVLAVAHTLNLRVIDDTGAPVPGASVALADEASFTNAEGVAIVAGLNDEDAITLAVSKNGHVPSTIDLPAPLPGDLEVELTRAFTIIGAVVTMAELPVDSGEVVVHVGPKETFLPLGPDGTFSVTVEAQREIEIEVNTRVAAPHRATVEQGFPGETRDLGRLQVADGYSVRGTVVKRDDGSPVAGARVWAPRQTPQGPLVAWMRGQIVEAITGENGRFDLRGIASPPPLLRVDLAGIAREITTTAKCKESPCEVGSIAVGSGATVTVEVRGAGKGAAAHLDLGPDRTEVDKLSQPLLDSTATFRHVPRGLARLRILRTRTILCERSIEVGGDGSITTFECDIRPLRVSGRVTSGGEPIQAGVLVWSSDTDQQVHAAIVTRKSSQGLIQQDTYGAPASSVTVSIANGQFATEDLRPGIWNVAWNASAAFSGSRRVTIPEVDSHHLDLDFPATLVRGRVLGRDGLPARRALVRALEEKSVAMTGADGEFTLVLPTGRHRLQAERGAERSPISTVEVDASKPTPQTELTLDAEPASVRVAVFLAGRPAPNVFLLAQSDDDTTKVLVTDANGTAALEAHEESSRLRFAAMGQGRWYFGPWLERGQFSDGVTIQMPDDVGSITITSATPGTPVPVVLQPQGWDVTRALTWLSITPRLPLTITGLPAGTYTIDRRIIDLRAGMHEHVELR